MKGLLLKDWYVLKSSWGYYLLLLAVFIACGIKDSFFVFYQYIFVGIIIMSLIAYEEKEKWEQYAATLPYTKAQVVSEKYILCLCLGAVTLLLNLIVQTSFMLFSHTYDTDKLLLMLFDFLPIALLPAAILLPFIFKFGMHKGRFVFYFVIGVFCVVSSAFLTEKSPVLFQNSRILTIVVTCVLYAVSWFLSIAFYKNREL